MADFLLELRSEEIPARMQEKARADLERLFVAELGKAGLTAEQLETYATPRRLALIAKGLPTQTEAVAEEIKGPKTTAPAQALEGFLRKTGLTRADLTERDGILFAVTQRPGRATADVLAEAIPAIVRAFPWPKSMRWGEASQSTESLKWVRPLQGIVALLGEAVIPCEIAGITSGNQTAGHRFMHTGPVTIASAQTYAADLRAAHVIVDGAERRRIIARGAARTASDAGLELIEDEGLLFENAGLTEWPVPLLGRFDEAFLQVPPEVIQLTARVNQKYFVCRDGKGVGALDASQASKIASGGRDLAPTLANAFVCTANIAATDGGQAIVEGNQKVLAARLSDARFFWDQDLKVPLDEQAKKLDKIVFHEKLGTVADKVDRVAKLARWLVEEGIVGGSSPSSATNPSTVTPAKAGVHPSAGAEGAMDQRGDDHAPHGQGSSGGRSDPSLLRRGDGTGSAATDRAQLAALAERAARLAKADLVTGMVGEFPELQGQMGGHYARAQGQDPRVADAIRDHYKPVGHGDEVPTAPVTVAVSLADKLDTLVGTNFAGEFATGSRDPFALRRAALGIIELVLVNGLRLNILQAILIAWVAAAASMNRHLFDEKKMDLIDDALEVMGVEKGVNWVQSARLKYLTLKIDIEEYPSNSFQHTRQFLIDRLKVQQREAAVRHDLIDAVFALGGEDDLVRLLARVHALQAFMATADGANLLAGYKRAANILKKEGWDATVASPSGNPQPLPRHPGLVPGSTVPQTGRVQEEGWTPEQVRGDGEGDQSLPGKKPLSYSPEIAEHALTEALDSAAPRARAAVEAEDFAGAMAALASLRAPIDAFFETVTVNDPDADKRSARLALLARMRDAVHAVADFSKIEG